MTLHRAEAQLQTQIEQPTKFYIQLIHPADVNSVCARANELRLVTSFYLEIFASNLVEARGKAAQEEFNCSVCEARYVLA